MPDCWSDATDACSRWSEPPAEHQFPACRRSAVAFGRLRSGQWERRSGDSLVSRAEALAATRTRLGRIENGSRVGHEESVEPHWPTSCPPAGFVTRPENG